MKTYFGNFLFSYLKTVFIRVNLLASQTRRGRKGRKMKAEIVDGNLVITLPMQTPSPSASGKTLVVASSHGNQKTEAEIDGKRIVIGVNAYIPR